MFQGVRVHSATCKKNASLTPIVKKEILEETFEDMIVPNNVEHIGINNETDMSETLAMLENSNEYNDEGKKSFENFIYHFTFSRKLLMLIN